MPLVSPETLATRRELVRRPGVLRGLADRLAQFLEPLDRDDVYIPDQKALLSRDGGVCVRDGSRLTFDPLRPHHHQCPRCGEVHQGERHHRAWIWHYHIWLSERAVHLALLGKLQENERFSELAFQIVDRYAAKYHAYPNRDNVLGPTRLFFSTYLESIWLIQVVVAAWLLNGAQPTSNRKQWHRVNRMVRESAGLVMSFNEGWSNRQVWNNAALIVAGRWLDDSRMIAHGLDGQFGVRAQLTSRVSEEGLWYEGENYHFFALRGFAFAAAALQSIGIDLYGEDGPSGVLTEMFAAPIKTLLPDLTIPARGDSPYGVSIVQPRFAELWEIGWARTRDPRLAAILDEVYLADVPAGPDPGLAEMAEQEQNRPPQKLARERLGWKALLWMLPDPPSGGDSVWRRESRLLPHAGVAVLRTAPTRYVSVECGGSPGGHGHPDLLHLTVFWNTPLLMDFGTGSYVSPSLAWYRSAMAHNAPAMVQHGQLARSGGCLAIDGDRDWAWCRVYARHLLGPDTDATRTIIAGPYYIIDMVEIRAPADVLVELPIHPLGGMDIGALSLAPVSQVRPTPGQVDTPASAGVQPTIPTPDKIVNDRCVVFFVPRPDEQVLLLEAPGPPSPAFADGETTPFLVRRAAGAGTWVQCVALRNTQIVGVAVEGKTVAVEHADGSHDRVRIGARTCTVKLADGGTRRLAGTRPLPEEQTRRPVRRPRLWCPEIERLPATSEWIRHVPEGAIVALGAPNYRRSESSHAARGPFEVKMAVVTSGTTLSFFVDVIKPDVTFRHADAPDPRLDNELPDIHSDGVQCYLDWKGWCGFVVVPERGSRGVRITPVAGTAAQTVSVTGEWCATAGGYAVAVTVQLGRPLRPADCVPVQLVVNEMYPDRERRTGQLALGGGGGWVYLRGDREDPDTAVIAAVA